MQLRRSDRNKDLRIQTLLAIYFFGARFALLVHVKEERTAHALAGNAIKDAECLLRAFATNKTLECLGLEDNELTDCMKAALEEA